MRQQGNLIRGTGPADVPISCGCLVLLHGAGASLFIGDRPVKNCVQLPIDVDSVHVDCDEEGKWTLEWFACKPGTEFPDPTPVAIPVGSHQPESLESIIARMVRRQVSDLAVKGGYDPEEAEDFDDDDDEGEAPTPYEFEEVGDRAEREQARLDALNSYVQKKRQAAAAARARKEANKAPDPTPPAEPAVG